MKYYVNIPCLGYDTIEEALQESSPTIIDLAPHCLDYEVADWCKGINASEDFIFSEGSTLVQVMRVDDPKREVISYDISTEPDVIYHAIRV